MTSVGKLLVNLFIFFLKKIYRGTRNSRYLFSLCCDPKHVVDFWKIFFRKNWYGWPNMRSSYWNWFDIYHFSLGLVDDQWILRCWKFDFVVSSPLNFCWKVLEQRRIWNNEKFRKLKNSQTHFHVNLHGSWEIDHYKCSGRRKVSDFG